MNIFPLDIEETYKPEESRTQITIDDVTFNAIKLSAKGLYIVKARNLDTASDEYYEYDEKTNTLIRYIEEPEDKSKDIEIAKYKKMLALLGAETVIVILVLICILIARLKKNKRRRLRIEEEKKKLELLAKEEKNTKKKKSTKKKEVLKNEKKKNN